MQPLVKWFDGMTGATSCVTGLLKTSHFKPHSLAQFQRQPLILSADDMFKFAQPEASVAAVAAWLQVPSPDTSSRLSRDAVCRDSTCGGCPPSGACGAGLVVIMLGACVVSHPEASVAHGHSKSLILAGQCLLICDAACFRRHRRWPWRLRCC
jgi:hypothetical protein